LKGIAHRLALARFRSIIDDETGVLTMFLDLISGFDSTVLVAYLDPGLGSMQLQIVIAALLSASFYLKSSYSQAKGVIGRMWRKAV
jgi:hypothetical protein